MTRLAEKTRSGDKTALYRAKRDFSRTSEPKGGPAASAGHLLIVQHHFARREHYDLRLQIGDALASWAVTRGPSANPRDRRLAVRVEDHPLDYAEFEGTIPKGQYGGGTVILWEYATYTPMNGDPAKARDNGEIKFFANGERMHGGWTLVRMDTGETPEKWLLIKERDQFAENDDSLAGRFTESVASHRSRTEIERGAPAKTTTGRGRKRAGPPTPAFVPPQLCGTSPTTPTTPGWLIEMKYDGYRLEAAVGADGAKVYSRSGLDWTDRFGPIAAAARALNCRNALIDGEGVVFNSSGVSDFAALVAALESGDFDAIDFVAFDLLTLDGRDLRKEPLTARKAKLKSLIGAGSPHMRFAEFVPDKGAEVFEAARRAGAEGVIAKRANAPYTSGRSDAWLKIKAARRDDVLIVGYMLSEKGNPFSSLLAAMEVEGKLAYVGRIGTGYSDKLRGELWKRLGRKARRTPPEGIVNPEKLPRRAMFVAEPFRAEIRFSGWTGDGQMRQARFLGVREDATMKASNPSTPLNPPSRRAPRATAPRAAEPTPITHADRVIFPSDGVTKGDVADYYARVAERMTPYLEQRLVSIIRAPDNIESETFFQRHPTPAMKRGVIRVREGDKVYMALEGAEGLRTAAQFGGVEFHGWMSRIDSLDQPDRLIFDLDPDPSVAFADVKAAAQDIARRLEAIDVKTWPMISGGKGVHVVAPLDRSLTTDDVETFARAFAHGLAEKEPARFIASMSKSRRADRIFIDWMRNKKASTAILPWSLRARATAPVATPLSWRLFEEVTSAAQYTIKTAAELADPWGEFRTRAQTIPKAVVAAAR